MDTIAVNKMSYLPVGRKSIKIPLIISNKYFGVSPTCSEVSRPLTLTCGSSHIFELQRKKQICRDHLASEEIREGIQIYQTLVVRVRFILCSFYSFVRVIDAIDKVNYFSVKCQLRDEVVF